MIDAKHPKNATATIQTIEGRPKTPEKARKVANDKLGDYKITKFFCTKQLFQHSYAMTIELNLMLQNISQ
jgi:hypothetical protein